MNCWRPFARFEVFVDDAVLGAGRQDLQCFQEWRAPGSRGSVHEVYDSKRPRSVDLGFCPIKTLGFRRRGLFGSRQSTLISQAIPRQTPGFLALSPYGGCTPEPQKIPSLQIQPAQERVSACAGRLLAIDASDVIAGLAGAVLDLGVRQN